MPCVDDECAGGQKEESVPRLRMPQLGEILRFPQDDAVGNLCKRHAGMMNEGKMDAQLRLVGRTGDRFPIENARHDIVLEEIDREEVK